MAVYRKFNFAKIIASSLLALLSFSYAQAATVHLSGSDATSITGFQPGGPAFVGKTYDIYFAMGTFNDVDATEDFIFIGLGFGDVGSFVFQLNDVLDGAGALTTGGSSDYNIPYADSGSMVDVALGVYNQNSDGLWGQGTSTYGKDSVFANWAIVTEVAAVPVPAAVWLFGSALLLLAGVKRRHE